MTANEILQAIGQPKNPHNMRHAGKLADVYRFLKAERKTFTIIETAPTELTFGRHTVEERNRITDIWETTVKNEGEKILNGVKITVTTARGKYSFAVPVGNKFHSAVYSLLNLENKAEIKPKKAQKCLSRYTFPASFAADLMNAKKLTSKDNLRPAMQCILIDISNGEAVVVATDAHRLYKSRVYKVPGKEAYQLLIMGNELKLDKKTDNVELEVLEGGMIILNDNPYALLSEERFPQWRVVYPDYTKGIEVDRAILVSKIKEVLPSSNKSTSQIIFKIGSDILLKTCDVDFGYESVARMPFIKKELMDFRVSISGKFLLEALSCFSDKTLTILTNGKETQAVLVTNGKETVLQMPLVISNDEDPGYEPAPAYKPKFKTEKLTTILDNYVSWLCLNYSTVVAHVYTNKMKIRYMKVKNGHSVTGEKTITLDIDRSNYLVPIIAQTIESRNQKIIYKQD